MTHFSSVWEKLTVAGKFCMESKDSIWEELSSSFCVDNQSRSRADSPAAGGKDFGLAEIKKKEEAAGKVEEEIGPKLKSGWWKMKTLLLIHDPNDSLFFLLSIPATNACNCNGSQDAKVSPC